MLSVGAGAFAQTAHYEGTNTGLFVSLGAPYGVAVDSSGNLFVADNGSGVVREILAGTGGALPGKISAFPTVITVASGFSSPYGVAIDASGNVYVSSASSVSEIEAVGGVIPASPTVVTLGSSFNNPFGVAVDPSGDVFVADTYNNALKEFVAGTGGDPAGTVSPASTLLTLTNVTFSPGGVAVDAHGNVFLTDRGSGVWEMVAGTGGAPAGTVNSSSTLTQVGTGFTSAVGVAVDAAGDLFIGDASPSANWVKEIVAVSGVVSLASPVITRDGSSGPFGVAVNGFGDIFASYPGYPLIAKFEPGATDFGTINVGNTSIREYIPFKFDSAGTPSGWSVETQGAQLPDYTEVTTGGGIVTNCSTSNSYSAGDACIVAVQFSPKLPGQRLGAVQMFDASGNVIATANLTGVGKAPQVVFPSNDTPVAVGSGFNGPRGVAVDARGNVFVADASNNSVKEIVAVGGQVSSGSTVRTVGSGFSSPRGVAVDGSGNVFVADSSNGAIKEIIAVNGAVSSSSLVNTLATGLATPFGVAVDARGNVFVADTYNQVIKEIVAVNGRVSSSSAVITLATTTVGYPCGVAVDADGNVFFADTNNKAIREIVAVNGTVSPLSTVITVGSGFSFTYDVSTDAAGDVFVADWGHSAVKEIVAVNGLVSSTSAVIKLGSSFFGPQGVAVDASGNVFAVDNSTSLVKEMALATAPSLTFATTALGSTSSDSAKTALIQNNGNADLTFTAVSFPTDFPDSGTSSCTGTTVLGSGAQCDLSIDFTPLSAGSPLSENVTLTNNALNAAGTMQSIPVSGAASFVAPQLTAPAPSGSTLPGQSATFSWNPGSATNFEFRIGTVLGANDVFSSKPTTLTSFDVTTLPTNGLTLYVRLYYMVSGVYQGIDYTFLEAGSPTPPTLLTTSPLTGPDVTFSWNPGTSKKFQFRLGSVLGANDLYSSGQTTSTSAYATGLPTNGLTIYARLYYRVNGAWQYIDRTYIESGTPTPPTLLTPTPTSTLPNAPVTFTWDPGTETIFQFRLGTVRGSNNIYGSLETTQHSVTVNTLPTDGSPIHARLYYKVNGVWQYIDYLYTAP